MIISYYVLLNDKYPKSYVQLEINAVTVPNITRVDFFIVILLQQLQEETTWVDIVNPYFLPVKPQETAHANSDSGNVEDGDGSYSVQSGILPLFLLCVLCVHVV